MDITQAKLNNLLGQVERLDLTGAFRTKVAQIEHLEIFIVTCKDNSAGTPGYNPDYPMISGSRYELVSGNERRTFSFDSHLKSYLKDFLNEGGCAPSRSILL